VKQDPDREILLASQQLESIMVSQGNIMMIVALLLVVCLSSAFRHSMRMMSDYMPPSTKGSGLMGGSPCKIKVIGVGGGGGNAVNRIIESDPVAGVEMWAVNTDTQALTRNQARSKLTIGKQTSRGLGAGGNPTVGFDAATESRDEIKNMVADSDMVFVTAGMGGGTGSGAAPVVAECARESGALTVGVVTKPFGFEGRKRMQQARDAILQMRDKVDTLIVVSNDKLLQIVPENTPLQDAFLVADDILRQGVVGISEIIIKPGLVNVDFADVRAIMGGAGTALMGIGTGKGKNRATDAAMAAITSPLLDFPITKAKGIVFNVVGGEDMSLQEINAAAEVIYENVDSDANIIFGAMVDDSGSVAPGEVAITVLATGFNTDFYDQKMMARESGEVLRPQRKSKPQNMPIPSRRLSSVASSIPLKTPVQTLGDAYDDYDDDEDDFFDDNDEDEEEESFTRRRIGNRRRGRSGGKRKGLGGIFGLLKRLLFG